MNPDSLVTIEIEPATVPQPIRPTAQFKGEVLPETTTPACPRRKVSSLPPGHLKPNHIASLEHNQKISSCCRHPENHEVEALKSHPSEPAPDIYIFHCTCGKKHRFFCVGVKDKRPVWA